MKLALAVWNGRVSPVFDTSRRLLVLEVEGHKVGSGAEHEIQTDDPLGKADRLAQLGVETLVCGAVSQALAEMVVARGIRLIPFVAGETGEVAAAFAAGSLPSPAMAMPGCCGRRLRFQHGRGGRGCRRGSDGW